MAVVKRMQIITSEISIDCNHQITKCARDQQSSTFQVTFEPVLIFSKDGLVLPARRMSQDGVDRKHCGLSEQTRILALPARLEAPANRKRGVDAEKE